MDPCRTSCGRGRPRDRDLSPLPREAGMRVTAARDAREARASGRSGATPVVLDLMMPGEPGLEFARWLRGSPSADRHPDAMGRDGRIVGLNSARRYVAMPFTPRALLRASAPCSVGERRGHDKSRRQGDPLRGWTWSRPAGGCRTLWRRGAADRREYELLLVLGSAPTACDARHVRDLLRAAAGPFDGRSTSPLPPPAQAGG